MNGKIFKNIELIIEHILVEDLQEDEIERMKLKEVSKRIDIINNLQNETPLMITVQRLCGRRN